MQVERTEKVWKVQCTKDKVERLLQLVIAEIKFRDFILIFAQTQTFKCRKVAKSKRESVVWHDDGGKVSANCQGKCVLLATILTKAGKELRVHTRNLSPVTYSGGHEAAIKK